MKRLALVGYGRIAPKHLEIFRHLGCEWVASCNRSEAGRQRAASEGGISATFDNVEEMLDRTNPDGVVCCASIDQIYPVARQLLQRRVPALLEKPPGTSYAQYTELLQLAQVEQAPVMVGLNRRHYSVIQRAVADAGGLDQLTGVFVDWSEDPRHFLARGFTPEQVALMVFGNSLHGIDLLTYLAGGVPEAHVSGLSLGDPLRWMMAFQGVSERGVLCGFQSTWDSPGRWRVSFCSPGRRYTFAPLEQCEVSESGSRDLRHIEPHEEDTKFKAGFPGQALAFLQMIETGVPAPGHELASVGPAMRLAQQLTDACLHAAPVAGR